jgi:hypothetical protein
MSVGAREGFPYHSVKLGLLANGNRYELDSNTFISSGKALDSFKKNCCVSCLNFFDTSSYLQSVGETAKRFLT